MQPKAYGGKYTDAFQPLKVPYDTALTNNGVKPPGSTNKYAKFFGETEGSKAYKPKVAPPASTPKGTYAKSGAEAKGMKGAVKPAAPAGTKKYADMMAAPFKGKY